MLQKVESNATPCFDVSGVESKRLEGDDVLQPTLIGLFGQQAE